MIWARRWFKTVLGSWAYDVTRSWRHTYLFLPADNYVIALCVRVRVLYYLDARQPFEFYVRDFDVHWALRSKSKPEPASSHAQEAHTHRAGRVLANEKRLTLLTTTPVFYLTVWPKQPYSQKRIYA